MRLDRSVQVKLLYVLHATVDHTRISRDSQPVWRVLRVIIALWVALSILHVALEHSALLDRLYAHYVRADLSKMNREDHRVSYVILGPTRAYRDKIHVLNVQLGVVVCKVAQCIILALLGRSLHYQGKKHVQTVLWESIKTRRDN